MMVLLYYILKVMVCSGCFYLYYQLALKNKVFHQWNRFYLLAGVLLSLVLPLIQIIILQPSEDASKAIQLLQIVQSADNYLEEFTVSTHATISPEIWITLGYIAVSLALFFSLIVSLLKILSIVRRYSSKWLHKIRFINTREPGTPFSFFHFIFWNDAISLESETGQQIFQHELVHVQEKHTLDKLLMQAVLILFWCNPFFWLIRRELKFIHEFIADKKAVGERGASAFAAMILQSVYPQHYNYLTNPFFQTAIKRRIKMLTKIQNPKRAYLSRIIALPLIALVAFAFTVRTKSVNSPTIPLENEIVVVIDAGHGIMANGEHNGARSGDVYEDDIVLALAKKIQEANTNDKIKIILTRNDDNIIGLKERVALAEKVKADLFISLHVNAVPSQMSVTIGNDNRKDGMEISVSNKNTLFQKQSELFGSVLQQQLQTIYKTFPTLIKRKVGVWVMDQNICPSVLVECGFITNDKDRAFLTQNKNQELVAQKILAAIQQYSVIGKNDVQKQFTTDTIPKSKTKIDRIDVDKTKDRITITYKDGNSETYTEKEATAKGLISNEGFTNDKKGVAIKPNGPKPLIILDGEKYEGDINDLDPKKIESVNVLKDKPAIDKYGANGKNGVIEITMKNSTKKPAPIYILDGKELSKEEMDKIDPNNIQSINVFKDKSATEKYGEKGKNGVVEITMKKTITFDKVILQDSTVFNKTRNVITHNVTRQSEPIFTQVDEPATFAPGKDAWNKILGSTLIASTPKANGAPKGRYAVLVKFRVNKDGTISDVKPTTNFGYGMEEEAVRVIENSPRWAPAKQNGRIVNSENIQPVIFVVGDGVDKL